MSEKTPNPDKPQFYPDLSKSYAKNIDRFIKALDTPFKTPEAPDLLTTIHNAAFYPVYEKCKSKLLEECYTLQHQQSAIDWESFLKPLVRNTPVDTALFLVYALIDSLNVPFSDENGRKAASFIAILTDFFQAILNI